MGPTEQKQMATVLESIAEHGLDHEVLDAESLAKRFPQYRLEDGDAAVLDRRAGLIRPELTVQSAARRAEQLGAVIHRYTPDLNPDPTRLSVYMEGYTDSSRPLVGPLPGAENDGWIGCEYTPRVGTSVGLRWLNDHRSHRGDRA